MQCWRRLLKVPWTASRSNQSIIKEISPKYSLEGQMWKLKLQYFGHLMWRTDPLEKTLMLGKMFNLCQEDSSPGEGDDRKWDGWMASPIRWTWVWAISGSWWWTGKPGVLQSMRSRRVGHDWETELNWTELNWRERFYVLCSCLKSLASSVELSLWGYRMETCMEHVLLCLIMKDFNK